MNKKPILIIISIIFTLFSSASSYAAVIDEGVFTRDTDGLTWLDVTLTQNMSYDSVQNTISTGRIISGVNFSDLRYATGDEVIQLALNYLDNPIIDRELGQWLQFDLSEDLSGLVSMLGCILQCDDTQDYYITRGRVSKLDGETYVDFYDVADYGPSYGDYVGRQGTTGTSHSNILGHYLVVNAVPVPAAVWLFGSGLLGLIGIARRKKA